MLTRIVRLTFRPESVADFLSVFEESRALIRAADGCLGVRLMRDVDDPNVFFTLSQWEGAAFLEHYRRSDLFKTTWERTKVLFAAPPLAHSTEDTGL